MALLLLAGVAVGCADRTHGPKPAATPAPAKRLRVVVLDGDLRKRVPNATVWIGRHRLRTNGRGVAAIRLTPAAALVRFAARGYSPDSRRWDFGRFPIFTFRVYQPRLQWTMYGAVPTRTGVHPSLRIRPPFRTLFAVTNGDLIEFPAVVWGGYAYIASGRGAIRAFSMRNGAVRWRRETNTRMASSLAVWDDKLVVHGMGEGRVRILDRHDGHVLWSVRIGSPIESSPVVRDGIDYFGAWNGRVYALDLRTHRLRWSYSSGAKITASVSLAGNIAYLGNYGGRVLALDARTGRLRWSGSVNGRVYGTAPVSGGRLFVPSSTGNSVTAFSTGGRRLWSFQTGAYVYSSPAAWAGRVIFGSYNGVLYCLSARSGRVQWTVRMRGSVSGEPVIVDGVAYASSFSGHTVGVDVLSGRVIFRFPHGHYVPISGNGGRLLLHGYQTVWGVEPRHRKTTR